MSKTKFRVMAKGGKVITTHVIDLNKVKSSDPLAYAYGLAQGERGDKIQKGKDLAPEYVRGWNDGHKNYKKKLKKVM